MRLAELEKRRAELLDRCMKVDRLAVLLRETDTPLPDDVRATFQAHVDLRVVEREIAKLKETKK